MGLFDRFKLRRDNAVRALPSDASRPDFVPVMSRDKQRSFFDQSATDSPEYISWTFASAMSGDTSRLMSLYKSSRRRDSRLDAVCASRVLAIQSRTWMLRPPPGFEGDAYAKEIAARATRLISEIPQFSTKIGHLAHATFEGFGVLEHLWFVNSRGEVATNPKWIHPGRFRFVEDEICIADTDSVKDVVPLSQFQDKFIVHAPVAGRSDYTNLRGALWSRMVPSLIKRTGLKYWFESLERFGQPQVAAFMQGADQKTGQAVLNALRDLGPTWRGVFPQGTDIKAIPVQLYPDLHQRFIEAANTDDAIAILGQNLTTEVQGGSFAAAKEHSRVRADILVADLMELGWDTLTDQLVRPLVKYNWPGAPVPVFEFVTTAKEQLTVQHFQAGLATQNEVRSSLGLEPTPEGDRFYTPPAALPGQSSTPPSAQLTLPASPGGVDAAAPLLSTSRSLPTSSPSMHPLASSLLRR